MVEKLRSRLRYWKQWVSYCLWPFLRIRDIGTTYTSTAYATMKGHLLRGEERVTVAIRDNENQAVDIEIVSISKPGPSLKSKVIWQLPTVGRMQRDFFQTQLDTLEEVANKHESEFDRKAKRNNGLMFSGSL